MIFGRRSLRGIRGVSDGYLKARGKAITKGEKQRGQQEAKRKKEKADPSSHGSSG